MLNDDAEEHQEAGRVIADANKAVASPQRLSVNPLLARSGLPVDGIRPRPAGARRDGRRAGRQLRTRTG